ncbi:unnamed protein product [Prunus armeniaca]
MAMMDTCGCSRIFIVVVHDEEQMVVVVIMQIGYPARLAVNLWLSDHGCCRYWLRKLWLLHCRGMRLLHSSRQLLLAEAAILFLFLLELCRSLLGYYGSSSFHSLCILMRVVSDLAHKCPYIYGAVPRCSRRYLWQPYIASRPRLSSRSGPLPLLLPYPMMCMSVSAMKTMWNTDVLEVNRKWEDEVGDSLLVPITYCHERDISKKLDLKPNMAKVHQALNISARFREWGWQLSEHRRKLGNVLELLGIENHMGKSDKIETTWTLWRGR